ncbi:2,3,4,5-tetrahydropyridine-2,6-dicarboxylate N-succinyltransferase [Arthrobacter castelli]|uniref:2,3,4,5-tetrahydropyridine-2,6-dicarboxylate N-succinyltransferase n=1 Tax=Arthrobacter castelli TaxID=271431 RepID=UPI0004123A5E|nr:2,3,4,5-tetrahydropyridine-2,6-dicarboxylate N-succinyltransferase [Arthrobacter castelli]
MTSAAENDTASSRRAYGFGLATVAADSTVLDVWYPAPALGAMADADQAIALELSQVAADGADTDRDVTLQAVSADIDLDAAPVDAADAYLRLHLLSHRLVRPNSLNMEGVFGKLANVVWTNFGPCRPEDFELTRLKLRRRGPVQVYGIDKFPRMSDYVVPAGVRIADTDRVRLGAHLATGSTVMHEGFVNFNAGTLGASMVEGRISAGVVIGNGTDVGGGASIMGTLSGGGKEKISLGERVLLGANSGVGISIGDDCVVEAGLYVTAGTRVRIVVPSDRPTEDLASSADSAGGVQSADGQSGQPARGRIVKAVELSTVPNLLFRRNSTSGEVEALPRQGQTVALNEALHAN